MSVLQKITMRPLPAGQFFDQKTPKNQIYVHHTAGNPDPYGVFRWWASTKEEVATALIIGGKPTPSGDWNDGDIVQCFNSDRWAYHLGLKAAHIKAGGTGAKSNIELNKNSIGIEICSWGQLTPTTSGFKTYVGTVVPDSEVQEYSTPFRGYKYYQKYTQAQLDNLSELLKYLCSKWSIPTAYKGDQMFNVDPRALRGEAGVWTHVSVRPDKNDCHPQPELISVLKSL